MKRILFAAVIVTGLVQAPFWAFVASVYFLIRGFSLGPIPAEVVTERTAIALGCAVLLVLNVTALNLFWGRGRGYALWLLATVETVDLVTSLALRYRYAHADSFEVSTWTSGCAIATVALLLILAFRTAPPTAMSQGLDP